MDARYGHFDHPFLLRARKVGEINDAEAMKRLERSPSWVWTAMDPTSKLLVVVDVGCRTLAMAQRVVHQVTRVLAPGCVPLFLTDSLKDYRRRYSPILAIGCNPSVARTRARGPNRDGGGCPRCSMRKW